MTSSTLACGTGAWIAVLLLLPSVAAAPRPCANDCQIKPGRANPAGIVWKTIPKGKFTMGAPTGKWWEQPAHEVQMSAFQLARSETTVAQYRACVIQGACATPQASRVSRRRDCAWTKPNMETFPMNCVTHMDAQRFCKWAGGRLPTEAQWEYASRSGPANLDYPWGREPVTCRRAIVRSVAGATGCNGKAYGHRAWPVCSRPLGNSQQGVCDLIGNVFEWTADRFDARYYRRSPKADPPGPPATGRSRPYFTVRGGCYLDGGKTVFTYRRFRDPATQRKGNVGFRCARSPDA